ncbi:kinesin heavy chain [Cryptosporidium ryanae]|uniref:kinesin heavy chain n=1 Tax=Cryptosporidium ryanae TaxID=515981 RepID=UPI00351A911B|nr:kinesin heavy chain [Cryptosporidium ryanae]
MNVNDKITSERLNKLDENNIIENYEKIMNIKEINNRQLLSHSESPFNVAIRFRPSNTHESSNVENIWDLSDTCVYDKLKKTSYFFDYVFDEKSTNQLIFDKLVKEVLGLCLGGINVTIFAYGQTSSGKTHTMLGDNKGSYDGIIPLSINEIFSLANNRGKIHNVETEFTFTVSYLEVYNERLIDLLAPQQMGNNSDQNLKKIKIVDGIDGNVELLNLSSRRATSYNDILEILRIGSKIRHVAETSMNERSSRSHTILRIRIDSKYVNSNDLRVGVLNFVDLAGSESIKRTQLEGERRKEGMSINRSLLAVSQVISQLNEISNLNENNLSNIQGQKSVHIENNSFSKGKYINYRDSKITRILSDSLGGNSKTIIVCNCSPDKFNYYETISTLDFAKRAKNIQNKIKVNILRSDEREFEVMRIRNEIFTLQKKLSSILLTNCFKKDETTEKEPKIKFLLTDSESKNQRIEYHTNSDFKGNNLDLNCDLCSVYKDRYLEILTKCSEIIDIKDVTIKNLEADINSFIPKLSEFDKIKECNNNLNNELKLRNEQIIKRDTKIDHLNKILFKARHQIDLFEAQLSTKNSEIFLLKEREEEINNENDKLRNIILNLENLVEYFIYWYIYCTFKKDNLKKKIEEKIQPDILMDEISLNILRYVNEYFNTNFRDGLYSDEIYCNYSHEINCLIVTRELQELKSDIIEYDLEIQKLENDITNSQINGISNLNCIIICLFEILNLKKTEESPNLMDTTSEQLGKLSISESYRLKKELCGIKREIEKANSELKEKRIYETKLKQLEFELDRIKTENLNLTKQLEYNSKENMQLVSKMNEMKYEIDSIRSIHLDRYSLVSEDSISKEGLQDLDKNTQKQNLFNTVGKENFEKFNCSVIHSTKHSEFESVSEKFNITGKININSYDSEENINKNEAVSSECNTQ